MVSAPFIWQQQIYNQDDFLFHKARLLAYYTAVVHEHTLVPRVLATMAGGFGYAADMFYNSLALLPFVVLKHCSAALSCHTICIWRASVC